MQSPAFFVMIFIPIYDILKTVKRINNVMIIKPNRFFRKNEQTKNFVKKCVLFTLDGHNKEIGNIIPEKIKTKIYSYIPEAREIWDTTINTFKTIENKIETPFNLKENPKLYALDGIIIADSLGIPREERFVALQVFSIYYLAVHLFDDLIEDPAKFGSKFSITTKDEIELHLKAAGVSFSFHIIMTIYQMLISNNKYKPKEINEISQKFVEILAKQIRYFALEKRKDMTPEKTLEIKQHCVSGEATSFIADCILEGIHYNKQKFKHIKKALFYLGSLTQFTDDLRDYKEDKKNNNANLLISMEKQNETNARNEFINWYLLENKLMLDEIKKTKLTIDNELISIIPWYPLFLK